MRDTYCAPSPTVRLQVWTVTASRVTYHPGMTAVGQSLRVPAYTAEEAIHVAARQSGISPEAWPTYLWTAHTKGN